MGRIFCPAKEVFALKSEGFSLFELLAILLILSVLAGFVVIRGNEDELNLAAEMQILKSHIRYVRHLALVNDVHSWEIRFGTDRYALYRNGSPAGLAFPNEAASTRRLGTGISLSLSSSQTGAAVENLRWDKWGRPVNAEALKLAMTDAIRGQSLDFQIYPETGWIQ
jgi:hypothetical protein